MTAREIKVALLLLTLLGLYLLDLNTCCKQDKKVALFRGGKRKELEAREALENRLCFEEVGTIADQVPAGFGGFGRTVQLLPCGKVALVSSYLSTYVNEDTLSAIHAFEREDRLWIYKGVVFRCEKGSLEPLFQVSGDGNTLGVGCGDFSSSVIHILSRTTPIQWTLETSIAKQRDQLFDSSLSISSDGNIVVAGASTPEAMHGLAYVFERLQTTFGDTWVEQVLKPSSFDLKDYSAFGMRVAISGDGSTIVVSSFRTYRSEILAFFQRDSSGKFLPQGTIGGSTKSAYQDPPHSVSLSYRGDICVLGSSNFANKSKGDGFVYQRSSLGAWTEHQRIIVQNSEGESFFGASTSLSSNGNLLLIGGPADGKCGACWVYARSDSRAKFVQQGVKLKPHLRCKHRSGFRFGEAVHLLQDGSAFIVGGMDPPDHGPHYTVAGGSANIYGRSPHCKRVRD